MNKIRKNKLNSKLIQSVLMPLFIILWSLFCKSTFASDYNEITPKKYTKHKSSYSIPVSCRFTIKRLDVDSSNIVYYLSKPKNKNNFPITILCGGSSSKNDIESIIHFHRALLQDFFNVGSGVLTVEQQGVDGNKVNKNKFLENYTRSQRLKDHRIVIENLKSNPPTGWNGKIIFLGVSEGGPIVTALTEEYPQLTIATINWSGAGDWPWNDELWVYIENMRKNGLWLKILDNIPNCLLFSFAIPKTRENYDTLIAEIVKNPTSKKEFMGMSYKYHADAIAYPLPNYKKIRTPLLAVAGAKDSFIYSCDDFVKKSKMTGVNITYMRVEDMDHYIRKRPDIIEKSFVWLSEHTGNSN